MRLIDPITLKKIKARSMKGLYKPSHEIFIEGEVGDRVPFEEGGLNKIIQGYVSSNARISNYVPTEDGRHMCAWTANVSGVGNRVIMGYTDTEEKYLSEHYPVEDTLTTDIAVTSLSSGQVTLYKRRDGKVLMLVIDQNNPNMSDPIPREGARVDCYLSETGNGNDFAFLSNVYLNYHNDTRGYQQIGQVSRITMPIRTKTGRLIVCFVAPYYSGWVWSSQGTTMIYTSDDEGETWQLRLRARAYNHENTIGQPCQIPDESIFVERQLSTGSSILYMSKTDGGVWSNVGSFRNMRGNSSWSGSLFYDEETDKAYRLSPGTYSGCGIYTLDSPTVDNFAALENWTYLMYVDSNTMGTARIWITPKDRLAFSWADMGSRTVILGFTFPEPTPVHAKSIEITRNEDMGGQLTVKFDNPGGILSPDSPGEFHKFFWPGKKIWIKQGYGEDMPFTYKGFIDDVNIVSPPQTLIVFCRDNLSLALDQHITHPIIGSRVNRFMVQAVEDVFRTLATWAGFENIVTEPTGMILLDKTFSWELYGDAFSWLADLVGFKYDCDEEGTLYFLEPKDRQPEATEIHALTGESWVDLNQEQAATYSERVRKLDSTPCVRGTDYEIDYGFEDPFQAALRRIAGGNIASGESVRISYVYPAYTFVEGEDIAAIDYRISRRELYAEVVVLGKGENDEVLYATAIPQIQQYGVQRDKVLPIQAQDAVTIAECQEIADRTAKIIETRARVVTFLAIAVPHLQKGDCIRVLEHTTTISEIYRIIDLGTSMDDNGYLETMTCYHYSHAFNPA